MNLYFNEHKNKDTAFGVFETLRKGEHLIRNQYYSIKPQKWF